MGNVLTKVAMLAIFSVATTGCREFFSASQTKSDLDPAIQAVYDKCITCHSRAELSVPENLKNVEDLSVYTAWLGEAQMDLMIALTTIDDEDKKKFKDYYKTIKPKIGTYSASSIKSCISRPSTQTIEAEKIDPTSSPLAEALYQGIKGDALVFYSEETVPKVWQHASIVNSSQSSDAYLIDEEHQINSYTLEYQKSIYEALGYFSDGPMEYPWKHSGGLDLSQQLTAYKFVLPPKDGNLMEVKKRDIENSPEYFKVKVSDVKGPQVGWEYQPGTMFGEVILNDDMIFEIRLRMLVKRTSDKSYWKMDVLRNFSNQAELASELEKYCKTDTSQQACQKNDTSKTSGMIRLEDLLTHIEITKVENHPASDTSHSPMAHSTTAAAALISEVQAGRVDHISKDVYQKLAANKKLKSVFGEAWTGSLIGKDSSWAPFSQDPNSFVGQNYLGAFLKLSSSSCMKCHSTAGKHVDEFDPAKDQTTLKPAAMDVQSRSRTWYNFLQGNDTVFSFHPFSEQAVGGQTKITRNGQINPSVLKQCIAQASNSTVPEPDSPNPEQPKELDVVGQQVWQNNCSKCHTTLKSKSQFINLIQDSQKLSQLDQIMNGAISRLSQEESSAISDFLP